MCGRYYVDDETAREIEKLVRDLDRKLQIERTGDVFPSQKATIIKGQEHHLATEQMRWGFPGFENGKLLINARAESALERRTFQDSVQHRRCIIPSRGFYEWNKSKEKFTFERTDAPALFMAGCYNRYEDEERFVILTTEANSSVTPIHNRMPLILEPEELEDWVLDDGATEYLLHKTPVLLKARAEYEQMRLF
ncbi:SOS response-associated peptidase [Mediterraneibacter sp. NSJ-151]|uniref:SOS response-associated peptidase n=1 Tax=Mediterraneibacter sp. NSJ-151 TaxID=2897708 RepID=UPI001F0AF726|nr:SOS response-associated peptidase [Mediterraneibacter sp. NSJ-151]MCH4280844.1 SOS response-associated peptidase [Mediterraneibacter sp. NSJ-151]